MLNDPKDDSISYFLNQSIGNSDFLENYKNPAKKLSHHIALHFQENKGTRTYRRVLNSIVKREKEKDLVLNATSFQLVVSVDYSNNPIGVYLEVHQSKDPKNKKSVRIGTGVRNFILAEERFKFCGVAKKSLTKLMLLDPDEIEYVNPHRSMGCLIYEAFFTNKNTEEDSTKCQPHTTADKALNAFATQKEVQALEKRLDEVIQQFHHKFYGAPK
jgi:hypothetical protein